MTIMTVLTVLICSGFRSITNKYTERQVAKKLVCLFAFHLPVSPSSAAKNSQVTVFSMSTRLLFNVFHPWLPSICLHFTLYPVN